MSSEDGWSESTRMSACFGIGAWFGWWVAIAGLVIRRDVGAGLFFYVVAVAGATGAWLLCAHFDKPRTIHAKRKQRR